MRTQLLPPFLGDDFKCKLLEITCHVVRVLSHDSAHIIKRVEVSRQLVTLISNEHAFNCMGKARWKHVFTRPRPRPQCLRCFLGVSLSNLCQLFRKVLLYSELYEVIDHAVASLEERSAATAISFINPRYTISSVFGGPLIPFKLITKISKS